MVSPRETHGQDPASADLVGEAPLERDRTSAYRDRTSEDRDRSAADRDRSSEGRDRNAEERDRAAEARDRRAGALGSDSSIAPPGTDERRRRPGGRRKSDLTAESDRVSAASDRAGAASDRAAAEAGREKGAHDRTEASGDRRASSVDRDASARERKVSSLDDLTGVYRRGAGLVELEREMIRAKRTTQEFVIAFVDVDGLKLVNDSQGHDVGDELLRDVVKAMRRRLRSYDLIVRLGGDEFVCSLSNVGFTEATERFQRINADLSEHGSSVTVGLAGLEDGDSLVELIATADEALYETRRSRARD